MLAELNDKAVVRIEARLHRTIQDLRGSSPKNFSVSLGAGKSSPFCVSNSIQFNSFVIASIVCLYIGETIKYLTLRLLDSKGELVLSPPGLSQPKHKYRVRVTSTSPRYLYGESTQTYSRVIRNDSLVFGSEGDPVSSFTRITPTYICHWCYQLLCRVIISSRIST